MPGDLVALGVIARPHGIQGDLRVHVYNPGSTMLLERASVLLRTEGGTREVAIEQARPGPKGAVLLTLGGVRGREAAEALRGAELCVPRSELPPPGEEEWYHVDLEGLAVHGVDGARRGVVERVIPYPSIDCLRVRGEEGAREVPMAEPWLVAVDLEAGRVVVDGWEELPLEPPGRRR